MTPRPIEPKKKPKAGEQMIKPMKGGPASVNPVAKMAPKERKAFQARIDYLRDLYRQREAQRAKQARKKK